MHNNLPPDNVAVPDDGDKKRPTRKITATTTSGSLALIVIYIASQFGLDVSAEEAAALVVLITTLAGYFVREGS